MPKRRRTSSGRPYTKFAKKPYRKRFTKRRGMASFIKRVMLKQCETKHKTLAFENAQMNHNSLMIPLNGLIDVAQGDSENQRTGDEVIGKYLKFKLWMSAKQDRPNVKIRLMVIRVPTDEESGTVSPFEGVIGNKLIDYINTEKYTAVYQKFITIQGNQAIGPTGGLLGTSYDWYMRERSAQHSFTIPLKDEKIKFLETGNTPKYQKYNLRFVALAYDSYGTLTTDTIATMAGNVRFYYKDP